MGSVIGKRRWRSAEAAGYFSGPGEGATGVTRKRTVCGSWSSWRGLGQTARNLAKAGAAKKLPADVGHSQCRTPALIPGAVPPRRTLSRGRFFALDWCLSRSFYCLFRTQNQFPHGKRNRCTRLALLHLIFD